MSGRLSEVQEILRNHPDLADVGWPQAEADIVRAEEALSVKFPESFREYLRRWGWISFGANEYMGLGRSTQSVVAETESIRRIRALPASLVVVTDHEGDEYVCLETSLMKNGECPVVIWDSPSQSISRPRAPTFDQFLAMDLRDFIE